MIKAIRIRIYPNKETQAFFARQFGACRFVYNHALRLRTDAWLREGRLLKYHDTAKILTKMKHEEEYAFLQEVTAQSLQQSLRHLEIAYQKFWHKEARYPQFKKRHGKQSFTVPQNFKVRNGKLHLPKCGPVRLQRDAIIAGKVIKVTVSKTPANRYFASFTAEVLKPKPFKKMKSVIGIDLGLTHFLVTSGGEKVASPKFLARSTRRLRLRQRSLSRREKGSHGRERQRLRVARIHERISDQRSDFLHKLSIRLLRENQAIAVESLNVKGMMANRHLSRAISDQGWSQFLSMLRYKAEWYGRTILVADRFFPSSKRCSACGWINEALPLSVRTWSCPSCASKHERDVNAAKNILLTTTLGIRESHATGDRKS